MKKRRDPRRRSASGGLSLMFGSYFEDFKLSSCLHIPSQPADRPYEAAGDIMVDDTRQQRSTGR
jgi:hypothetical protein